MSSSSQKKIIKKLLEYDFYKKHQARALPHIFDEDFNQLVEVITDSHRKYKHDLTDLTTLRELYLDAVPILTRAQTTNLDILLDGIKHEDNIPEDMAVKFLRKLQLNSTITNLLSEGIKVTNGQVEDLYNFNVALKDYENFNKHEADELDVVNYDLEKFLEDTDQKSLFNFRLPTIASRIPGIGRGNFGIIFARPEAGKTSFCASETAGYLQNGHNRS
jgi:hypothetical protein